MFIILQGSHQFLEVVDQLLPLARVGCDGCLMPVRSSFIDTVCICLKSFHMQLVKVTFLSLILSLFLQYCTSMSICQSQFSEKGFKKTENVEHSGVLLLFLFTLNKNKSGDTSFPFVARVTRKIRVNSWNTNYSENATSICTNPVSAM